MPEELERLKPEGGVGYTEWSGSRSWRERDAEMNAAGCYDVRDLPKDHDYARGRNIQLKEQGDGLENIWTDPD